MSLGGHRVHFRDWIAIVLAAGAVMQRVNILIGQVNAANVPPSIHYRYNTRQQQHRAKETFAFVSYGQTQSLSFCVLNVAVLGDTLLRL